MSKHWRLDKNGKLPERTQNVSLAIYATLASAFAWLFVLRDAGETGGTATLVGAIVPTIAAVILWWIVKRSNN